jgi:hypothetical protein
MPVDRFLDRRAADGHDRVSRVWLHDRHPGCVDLGISVRVQGTDGADIGFAHAPGPLARGDLLALADGSTWRVVSLIDVTRLDSSPLFDMKHIDRMVDVLCMVEPIEV